MKALGRNIGLLILLTAVSFGATTGVISGTVRDNSGTPMKGAFVRARNSGKITITVLSDRQGRYRIENLLSGEYEVWATAIGYQGDSPARTSMTEGKSVSRDIALQKGIVRWSDLTEYQGKKLLPEGKGKEMLLGECYICHGFQTRMAATKRDEAGWVRAVNFMKEAMRPRLAGTSDQDFATVAAYLNSTFGVDSKVPKSPAELPGYGGDPADIQRRKHEDCLCGL